MVSARTVLGASIALLFAGALHQAEAGQCGKASYYGTETGSRTASGERLATGALTAAHRTLPFGTQVKVDNLANGRSVTVRINDRGPFIRGRVIDVTKAAAVQLGMIGAGVAPVRVTVVGGSAAPGDC